VHQLEIKVLHIVDAQCNHEVHQSILIALIPSHSHHFFTNWHYQSLCHFNWWHWIHITSTTQSHYNSSTS